jgi:replicative DNA helicase
MIDTDIDSWKNAAAERAILGILMSEPDEASRIIKNVTAIDFFFPEHQSVFKKAVDLHTKNMPVDFVSLLTEQINADLLVTMSDESMRVNGVDHLLTLIKTLSMKRYIFNACQSIKATIEKIDAETPQQVRSHVLGLFDKEVPKIEQDNSIVSIVEKMQDSVEKERTGQSKRLVWGMREIDTATGGLWGSELTIIAAGPGTGKTAMAIQMANKISQQGNVLFVSREMSDIQISKRLVSNLGGINGEKLRIPSKMTDEELDKMWAQYDQLT